MLFNTRFWLVKVLLTPTIEKMIFFVCHISFAFVFSFRRPGTLLPLVPRRADPPPPCGSPERFRTKIRRISGFSAPAAELFGSARVSGYGGSPAIPEEAVAPKREGDVPPGTKAPSAVTSGPTGRFARASAGLSSQTADSDRRIVWRLRTEKQRYRKIRCLFMQFPQRMIVNIFIIYVDLSAF